VRTQNEVLTCRGGTYLAAIQATAIKARLSVPLQCTQASEAAAQLLFPLRGRRVRQVPLKLITGPETNKLTIKILAFLKGVHTPSMKEFPYGTM